MSNYCISSSCAGTKDYIDELALARPKMSAKEFSDAAKVVTERIIKNIIDTPNPDISSYSGTVYYVSENGDDKNDGKSPEKAWRSLVKVSTYKLCEGDAVLFERGGLWRGNVNTQKGVTYSSYGTGFKPTIYGSYRNFADESIWEETEWENVYRLNVYTRNVGTLCFDIGDEIGDASPYVAYKRMLGYGPFYGPGDLDDDLQFYSDLNTDILYLYSKEGNPGKRFKSIEICERSNLFTLSDDVTIENFCVKYVGGHGVGGGTKSGLTVRNCIFCWIGGSILGTGTTLYGNAVEIYGGCFDYTVENNYIYQIYDTGITNQCGSNFDAPMENIRFFGNVIEYTHWPLEYYNRDFPESVHYLKNEYMGYNVCRYGGYGWGSRTRPFLAAYVKSCGLTEKNENFVIERNLFVGTRGYNVQMGSGGDLKIKIRANIYIQKPDCKYAIRGGNEYSVGHDEEEAKKMIAADLGDNDAVVCLYDDQPEYKLMMKEKFAH